MSDKTTLANALMFDYAYSLLHEKLQNGAKENNVKEMGLLFVPVAVNCAFSCELLLKSILPVGTWGHKLTELFNKLDTTIASGIRKNVITIMQTKHPDYSQNDFKNDLSTNEAAFEEWRYFHEGKNSPSFNVEFMYAFQKCLKAYAKAYIAK